jgi:hypothetical protein
MNQAAKAQPGKVSIASIARDDTADVQCEVLFTRIVPANVDCEFGRKHNFQSIRTIDDYRKAVPICRYDDLRPDIERMKTGEPRVLVSEPVRRFFITSGSMAQPKFIPVTSKFIRAKWKAFQSYWSMVRRDHPDTTRATWVVNFSDSGREQSTAKGILCSSESAFWTAWSRGGDCSADNPLPRPIVGIADHDARYYTIARVLLETDISLVMSLNPSTIVRLFETIEHHSEQLVADVAHGGISANVPVGRETREYLGSRFRPNPARADQLAKLLGDGRRADAAALWPHLRLVACWRSPMVRPFVKLLEPRLDGIPQRDYLMMASEGIVAIPFEDGVSGGALAVETHFYEFIPEHLAEGNQPATLLAHELEAGKTYVVVLSTSAGLYRYNIGDVVHVRGFAGSTPIVEFLYRAGNTCSLTGEKLTERQVVDAVSACAARMGIGLQAFTMCPAIEPFPHYAVVAELKNGCNGTDPSSLAKAIDGSLRQENIEYQAKRASGRLGSPELVIVAPGSYEALRQRRVQNGANDAQVKIASLTRDPKWPEQFEIVGRHRAD